MISLFLRYLFFSRSSLDEAIAKKISRMSENEAQTLKARRQKAASKQKRFLIVCSSLEPRHKVRDEPVVKKDRRQGRTPVRFNISTSLAVRNRERTYLRETSPKANLSWPETRYLKFVFSTRRHEIYKAACFHAKCRVASYGVESKGGGKKVETELHIIFRFSFLDRNYFAFLSYRVIFFISRAVYFLFIYFFYFSINYLSICFRNKFRVECLLGVSTVRLVFVLEERLRATRSSNNVILYKKK